MPPNKDEVTEPGGGEQAQETGSLSPCQVEAEESRYSSIRRPAKDGILRGIVMEDR
jgi:hypothetical protein